MDPYSSPYIIPSGIVIVVTISFSIRKITKLLPKVRWRSRSWAKPRLRLAAMRLPGAPGGFRVARMEVNIKTAKMAVIRV